MPYRVEKILSKGEIASYKQFLLFSQCFQQLYISSESNVALCGNGLRPPAVRYHFYYFPGVVSEYRLYCICNDCYYKKEFNASL